MDEKAVRRFMSKIDRGGPVPSHCPELGPCHVWTGHRSTKGYGFFSFNKKNILAHRVAFFLTHGRWPEPCALHKCDGGSIGCVRVEHLFEGTKAENNADMAAKGRADRDKKRGEQHPRAKFTNADVLTIRALRKAGAALSTLSLRFGVSKSAISNVARGKRWSHL